MNTQPQEPRKDPVFIDGTLPAGALDLSVQEVRVAKVLFLTCFQREVEKYPQRFDMTAYKSMKDKITEMFNALPDHVGVQ